MDFLNECNHIFQENSSSFMTLGHTQAFTQAHYHQAAKTDAPILHSHSAAQTLDSASLVCHWGGHFPMKAHEISPCRCPAGSSYLWSLLFHSTSPHLGLISVFYCSWLCNFSLWKRELLHCLSACLSCEDTAAHRWLFWEIRLKYWFISAYIKSRWALCQTVFECRN